MRLSRFVASARKLRFSYTERNEELKSLPNIYPLLHGRDSTTSIADIHSTYDHIVHTVEPTTPELTARGRVKSVRRAGRGLTFVDIEDQRGVTLQIVINHKRLVKSVESPPIDDLMRRGDAIEVCGLPWRTRAGELSLLSTGPPVILSPCLHPLPDATTAGEASSVLRQHNRVAELKAFSDARKVLLARDCIVATLTNSLRRRKFIQVQTPILSGSSGGASATPFKVESDLFLRVAPELWLKRLIIGGLDRVFEVGPSFRNEGVDASHNPEFTTCELYQAFATLDDLMDLTQDLLREIGLSVATEFPEFSDHCETLRPKFQVIDFVPALETAIGEPLTLVSEHLRHLCVNAGIPLKGDEDEAHLLDKLGGHYLEPQCIHPTFIINHPEIMAPLAKSWERGDWRLSRRFELLINGVEYVNAYEEENNPESQYAKLSCQNSSVPDKPYVEALEWGLPPTGGWGLGIDRLVMLLTGSKRIGEVLSFGGINQVNRQ